MCEIPAKSIRKQFKFEIKVRFKKKLKNCQNPIFLCTIPMLAVEGVKKFKIVSVYVDFYVL